MKYNVIGLMSGSSLDGLDLAYCEFEVKDNDVFDFKLICAENIPFLERWVTRLKHLPQQNALTFFRTHTYFGHYMGDMVNDFIKKYNIKPDFIASHGHTIFHDPERQMTAQIGDGAALAARTGLTVICDFRTNDISIGGEGTPIAPAADRYLFSGYDFYLNVGGIANVTCNANGKMIAFDVGPANQVFNGLANVVDLEYDNGGELAKTGQVDEGILALLEEFEYFTADYPKSLGNGWIQSEILPLYLSLDCPLEDKLRTSIEHLAFQIAYSIEQIIVTEDFEKESYTLFATGGGVLNTFLMEEVQKKLDLLNIRIVIPEKDIIDYKEAILMGLMGVLRMENKVNCFSSVTGAQRDTIGGAVYLGS
jgi:anhydro-N-acetylmuramic acid kinase